MSLLYYGFGVIFFMYLALVVIANRFVQKKNRPAPINLGNGNTKQAGKTLTLATWNIGFAGMGDESDFVADGGKGWRAPAKEMVLKNLAGIMTCVKESLVKKYNPDCFLFQEIATASPITHQVSIEKRLRKQLSNYLYHFYPLISPIFLPWPWRFRHGLGFFSKVETKSAEIIPLPLENKFYGGFLRLYYGLQVLRLPINDNQEWVIINLHFSAFDKAAKLRKAQLKIALDFAQTQYKQDKYVVLGGDLNLLLADSKFPHKTAPKHLDWVHYFPQELLPTGWKLVADKNHATVRSLEKSYVKNENYRAIIDGFIVAPNLTVKRVQTVNTQFKFSDHNPVVLKVQVKL